MICSKSKLVFIKDIILKESAKLCALPAKDMLACQRALHAYVRAYMPCMLTCLGALHAHVPTCLACLHAYMLCVLTCSGKKVPSSITLIHL